jgi:SPFH domain / Band 7 family
MSAERNLYLEEAVASQERLEQDLRAKRSAPVQAAAAPQGVGPSRRQRIMAAVERSSAAPSPSAVDVRITGVWRWKTVLVPPNAFVVHTRRGHPEPLHVGLGTSFRFDPTRDSYLVVPGAMQTILINAYCICRELQGLVVQAYVQWIIQDIATAYRKLDFSDADDPMRLVNLQLKEQAEAAIKDKVATMSVHEVLSDKEPIVEELTARLRAMAEGSGTGSNALAGSAGVAGNDRGLGLRIVTVQIKEAIVSSARLWENLQKPFRAEQGRIARLAELGAEEAITERELTASRVRDTQRLQTERELDELRASNEAAAYDREATERVRRAETEQEAARRLADLTNETTLHELRLEQERGVEQLAAGRARAEREHELARLAVESELALAHSRTDAEHTHALLELERVRIRAAIDNEASPENLQAKLIDALPDIVARLPKPAELRAVTINGQDGHGVAALIAELGAVVGALRSVTDPR